MVANYDWLATHYEHVLSLDETMGASASVSYSVHICVRVCVFIVCMCMCVCVCLCVMCMCMLCVCVCVCVCACVSVCGVHVCMHMCGWVLTTKGSTNGRMLCFVTKQLRNT